MGLLDVISPAKALIGLLEAERKAILASDFQKLEAFSRAKEARLQGILRGSHTKREIVQIRKRVVQNARLLEAAASGIKSAQSRLELLEQTSRQLQTYGPNGTLDTCGYTRGSLTRKA